MQSTAQSAHAHDGKNFHDGKSLKEKTPTRLKRALSCAGTLDMRRRHCPWAMHWSRVRWPLASLRTYLHVIALAAVLPLALLTAWLVSRQITLARHQLSMGLHQSVSSLAQMIDQDQAAAIEGLQTLANTAQLQREDARGFARVARTFLSVHPTWRRISLIEARRGAVLSALTNDGPGVPGDMPKLPPLDVSTPGFSGLLQDVQSGQWFTRIALPVWHGGKPHYLLALDIDGSHWQQLINGAVAPGDGFITLYDDRQTIIARTRNPQSHVGHPLPHGPADRVAGASQPLGGGFRKIAIPDDGEAYVAWQRIPRSGWGVRVGVSATALDRDNLMAWLAVTGAGLVSLAAGLILSRVVTARVTKPLGVLAQGKASSLKDRDVTVFEIAMLRNAMLAAEQQRDTARQRLEAKAAEFETLFLLSPIGLSITLDTDCKEVLRNPAKVALFDMSADGARAFELVANGQVIPPSQYPLARAVRGERIHGVELDVCHHDGRTLRVLAHAVPLLNLRGAPRGAIATFVDITEQVQSKTKLMLAQASLDDNQHFIELAQKAGDVGFLDHAVAANRITMSSGLSLLFGLGSQAMETTWEVWLSHLDAQDADALAALLTQAWQDRQELVNFKLQLRCQTDSVRWLSCRAVCMYDPAGRPLRMIGAVVNVTAQQQMEHERNRLMAQEQAARQEAEQANRAKDEFLAILGHELRNPLGAISAGIEVLNRISSQGDQPARVRAIITRQTRHLARLMDDLLDVARVIAGKIQLSLSTVSLNATVQRTLNTLKIAGLTQTIETDIDDVWVRADTLRLEQIINNLVTNAGKYSPPDTPIQVIGKAHGDMVRLQIINHGQGIPSNLLPHIFDLFVQGERTIERRQGGLGIGLTLVKSLVDLHHGRIEVTSADNRNIFTVDLPAAAPALGTLQLFQPVVASHRRVLVIEDNDDARETVRMMLDLKGHEVEVRANGQQGLEALTQWQPHLALVDIGLPGLSGYEVAQRARDAGFAGWLIALSGYGQQQDVRRALESGFDFHMVKPLDEQILDQYLSHPQREDSDSNLWMSSP